MSIGSDQEKNYLQKILQKISGPHWLKVELQSDTEAITSTGGALDVNVVSGGGGTGDINLVEIGGVTILAGAGATGTGSQRVTIAQDSTTVAGSASLPAGTNAIGKLSANSGVDIGDVDITSLISSAANAKVDVGLINAVTPLMGNGPSGTGALRVALVNDGTGRIATLDTLTSGNVGGFTTIAQSTLVMSVAGVYATGDYMGTTTTPQSFANAARVSGGTGVIKSILISDKILTTNVDMELWIIDRTFTAPTDNAAWNLSDTNMLFVQGVIPIATTDWYASSAGQVYSDATISIPFKISTGTELFYALVARGTTPTFTSADLTISIGILQD